MESRTTILPAPVDDSGLAPEAVVLHGQLIEIVTAIVDHPDQIHPTDGLISVAQAQRLIKHPPEFCDHAGATWSASLALTCPSCGIDMFLPRQLLAFLPRATVDAMHALWCAAGWPEYDRASRSWGACDGWTLCQHPLFDHVGGLLARNTRQHLYNDAVIEIAALTFDDPVLRVG